MIAGRFAALSVLFFTACEPTGTANGGATGDAKADLKVMADKVTYLKPPDPKKAEGMRPDALLKRSVAAADPDCPNGMATDESIDSSAPGGHGILRDTTRNFTSAGTLACGDEDETAWTTMSSYAGNDVSESWTTMRLDFSSGTNTAFLLKMTGSGRTRYRSGYDMTMDSFLMTISPQRALTEFRMDLGLEGGAYQVPLAMSTGLDLLGESEPAPDAVIMEGPIRQGGTKVGYFQVLADDRVHIEDGNKDLLSTK